MLCKIISTSPRRLCGIFQLGGGPHLVIAISRGKNNYSRVGNPDYLWNHTNS